MICSSKQYIKPS